jgi:protocatechuate 3,4-dioxygenase beta subunit
VYTISVRQKQLLLGFFIFLFLIELALFFYSKKSPVVVKEDIVAVTPTITIVPQPPCLTLTVATTEGPYYIGDTAEIPNHNLNYTNLPGTPVKVIGTVYSGTDNTKPISRARIELWQADAAGKYHPNASGRASEFAPEEIGLRGYVWTDEKGRYEFTSIYPGYYEGRARHIHARVSAYGHQDVFTQIIFEPKASDGVDYKHDDIAQSLPACHLLKVVNIDGIETGSLDFRLQ